jgi:hypothetical protein
VSELVEQGGVAHVVTRHRDPLLLPVRGSEDEPVDPLAKAPEISTAVEMDDRESTARRRPAVRHESVRAREGLPVLFELLRTLDRVLAVEVGAELDVRGLDE